MDEKPKVILSALADEAAFDKTADQQFSALAALGLQYYSIRFIDVGSGIKNALKLNKTELNRLRHLHDQYGMNVASLASPIGKVKLLDKNDGTKNKYVPFKKYLDTEVKKACLIAHALETKLIRGFSFYPPKGSDPRDYISQAVDQLGQIAETCHRSDLTFGLEVEANLVGCSGEILAEIHRQVNHPELVLVFDAANLLTQGYTSEGVIEEYRAMKPGIGWLHIKDYKSPSPVEKKGHVDEDALKHFVPADVGDGAHEMILRDFRDLIPKLQRRFKRRGIPGVILDLEPHLRGGGQFGGFSGPDGMGVALRGLRRLLAFVGIDYHLRDFADVQAALGE